MNGNSSFVLGGLIGAVIAICAAAAISIAFDNGRQSVAKDCAEFGHVKIGAMMYECRPMAEVAR